MKPFLYFLIVFAVFLKQSSFGQVYGDPFEQTVSVAGVVVPASSHAIVKYDVPPNAIGLVVRFTTKNSGRSFDEPSLFSLLELLPSGEATIAGKIAKFAITSGDDNDVDFEILTTGEDADNFKSQLQVYTRTLMLQKTISSCFFIREYLNNSIYFGVENNNILQGIHVKVEVVPILSTSGVNAFGYAHDFTFQVKNRSDVPLEFEYFDDWYSTWRAYTLNSGETANVRVLSPNAQVRIRTSGTYKQYTFPTDRKAKLYWNERQQVYDIAYY